MLSKLQIVFGWSEVPQPREDCLILRHDHLSDSHKCQHSLLILSFFSDKGTLVWYQCKRTLDEPLGWLTNQNLLGLFLTAVRVSLLASLKVKICLPSSKRHMRRNTSTLKRSPNICWR